MSVDGPPRVGVVGGGAWGVALALGASRAGSHVTLLSRRDHPELPTSVRVTTELALVAEARLLVLAVPSKVVRSVARSLGDHLDGAHLLVHGIRGLGGTASLETVSEVLREETPARRLGALGGPVQADELTAGRPSAMVIGSRYPEVTAAVVRAFQSEGLRVYSTPDIRGLEWASALVGCLSIGVGFAEQAGAGPGLLAAVISRAVEEGARIAAAAGAEERTMLGLGGYGDLLASIALEDRPEVVVGKALARGRTLDEAIAEAKLRVEAIELVPRVVDFARAQGVPAPSFDALVDILAGKPPAGVLSKLFAGTP